MKPIFAIAILALVSFVACSDGDGCGIAACDTDTHSATFRDSTASVDSNASVDSVEETTTIVGEDFIAEEADFKCLKDWTQVRRFFVANGLDKLDEALAVANNPAGGTYPVGTILQLVPAEAMVKRGQGFSAESNDWEFFDLQVSSSGTSIKGRGGAEQTNIFGLSCLDCHKLAAPQWDFVCEQDHGCDPLGLSDALILNAQDGDPRCP